MMALSRFGLAVALLSFGLLLCAGCNRNSNKRDTGIIPDAQAPVMAMDAAVDVATDRPPDFAMDAAGGKDAFSATGGAGGADAFSGTGGAIGTDGGTAAADARTVTGDTPGADTPPDVPVGGSGGTGGTMATGGMTGTGGSTAGAGAGGVPTTGGTRTTGGTAASGGTSGSGGVSAVNGSRPSCVGLPATCGPSGNESCCTDLLVPGGNFYRTDLVSTYPPNSFPATVADFYLDKYEITVGRFRQFVDAGKGTQASPPVSGAGANLRIEGSGWDSAWNASLAKDMDALNAALKGSPTYCTWTDTAGSNESRPLNCLDWYTAFAFCEWDGARLATEAEWGYAAAGGDEQRKYPWGSAAPDPSKASYYPDSTQKCMGDGVAGCSMADFIVVGSKPAGNGRWGHADLAGNVEEWTLDGHAAYPNPTYPYQCNNCANISVVSERMLRGGSFRSDASGLVSDARGGSNPVRHDIDFGARCARNAGAVNKAAGADCTASAECETGLACLDGVCCKQSSCPVCRNCGGDGTCSITVSSTDDTSGLSCMGNDTCDAAGACKKKNGQGCAAPGECASGNCNSSGVCAALRCPGLAATCGPSGNGDCCASLAVSGGTFYEGYDGVTYTDMSRPATVADFYLDTYEITVGRFRQFVEAGVGTQLSPPASGAGAHPLINGSGWDSNWNTRLPADTAALKARMKCLSDLQTWTDIAGGNESRPQNCLDWYTAFAFCVWDGGRLPTESEWNYVASGGSEQREYPWGSGVDYSKASYNAMGDGDPVLELTDLLVVGSKPAGNGKWGHADLAGNVDEWTLTGDQNGRVIRGGDFIGSDSDSLRSVGRSVHVPSFSYEGFGVRCARTSL